MHSFKADDALFAALVPHQTLKNFGLLEAAEKKPA